MTLFNSATSTFEFLLKSMVAEQQPESPINIEEIAKSLGIEVIYEPLLCGGHLEEIGQNKYLIRVNNKTSKVRQRFTIAHELGHLFLKLVGSYKIMCLLKENLTEEARFIRDWSNNERVCNLISASLLVPLRTVKQLSDWRRLSIRIIEHSSKEWVVSNDVLLRRVLTLAAFEGGFIWGKIMSDFDDPRRINLHRCWGIFPKSRKVKIPKEMCLQTLTHSLVDFMEKKETFDRVKFDVVGLKGLRTICAKAYGKGDEKRILILVYPREIKQESIPLTKCLKQSILPIE